MDQHKGTTEGQRTTRDLDAFVTMVTEGPSSRTFHANAKLYFPDCTDVVPELSLEHNGRKVFEYLRGALVDEEKAHEAEALKTWFAGNKIIHLGFYNLSLLRSRGLTLLSSLVGITARDVEVSALCITMVICVGWKLVYSFVRLRLQMARIGNLVESESNTLPLHIHVFSTLCYLIVVFSCHLLRPLSEARQGSAFAKTGSTLLIPG
jgi:hypothetical protein